jgi:hypothetical protein
MEVEHRQSLATCNLRRVEKYAPVAQLDRASVFGTEGWGFESLRAYLRHKDLRRRARKEWRTRLLHVAYCKDGKPFMAQSGETAVTVLDHIDNIAVPGNIFAEPANEYWALVWLRDGMEFLYHQVHRCDEVARQQVNPGGNCVFACSGSAPVFPNVPRTLVTSAFHWYTISACQYVGTVGAIAHRQDKSRPSWRDYVKAVIPEVFAFRNKVAAHFAWCIGDNRDNPAERFASISPSLIFAEDCFHISGYTVQLRQAGKVSGSAAIPPWSLSKVHERLRHPLEIP